MVQKSIEEIRQLVDPEGYKTDLEEVKQGLISNRGRLFVNLDLNHDDPTMNKDERDVAIAVTEKAIQQTQWRIERIEERVKQMLNGALPSRKARRAKREKKAKSA